MWNKKCICNLHNSELYIKLKHRIDNTLQSTTQDMNIYHQVHGVTWLTCWYAWKHSPAIRDLVRTWFTFRPYKHIKPIKINPDSSARCSFLSLSFTLVSNGFKFEHCYTYSRLQKCRSNFDTFCKQGNRGQNEKWHHCNDREEIKVVQGFLWKESIWSALGIRDGSGQIAYDGHDRKEANASS